MIYERLEKYDPEVDGIIRDEEKRQRESLELIASENFTSVSVMQANGSVLTNKYSEGQVGCRYYGGNENIDRIEALCKTRALELFGLDPGVWDVNVQALSGSAANLAVYTGLLGAGGRLMGLDLPSGGHLTHGYQTAKRKVSATAVFFESRAYRVGTDGLIDYDRLAEEAKAFRPQILICGGSAYVREFDYLRFREIAGDAFLMMDMAHVSGFVATKGMASPFDHCDVVTTTTHKILRGPRAALIFYKRSLVVNGSSFSLKTAIDNAVFPGLQDGPHNQKIAALAVALRQAASPEYKAYANQVLANAQAMASALQRLGYELVTGGTDCHMVLLRLEKLGGAAAEKLCELVNICVNKNCIFSDRSPLSPSAIRLGTPALTTRGFLEDDFKETVGFIHQAILIATDIKEQLENKNDMNLFVKLALEDPRVEKLRSAVIKFACGFDIPRFNYRQ